MSNVKPEDRISAEELRTIIIRECLQDRRMVWSLRKNRKECLV